MNQPLRCLSASRLSAVAAALGALLAAASCQPGVSPALMADPIPLDIGTAIIEPVEAEVRVGDRVRFTTTLKGTVAGSDTVVGWLGDAKVAIQPLPCTAPGATRSCAADVVGVTQGTTVLLFAVHLRTAYGPSALAGALVTIRP